MREFPEANFSKVDFELLKTKTDDEIIATLDNWIQHNKEKILLAKNNQNQNALHVAASLAKRLKELPTSNLFLSKILNIIPEEIISDYAIPIDNFGYNPLFYASIKTTKENNAYIDGASLRFFLSYIPREQQLQCVLVQYPNLSIKAPNGIINKADLLYYLLSPLHVRNLVINNQTHVTNNIISMINTIFNNDKSSFVKYLKDNNFIVLNNLSRPFCNNENLQLLKIMIQIIKKIALEEWSKDLDESAYYDYLVVIVQFGYSSDVKELFDVLPNNLKKQYILTPDQNGKNLLHKALPNNLLTLFLILLPLLDTPEEQFEIIQKEIELLRHLNPSQLMQVLDLISNIHYKANILQQWYLLRYQNNSNSHETFTFNHVMKDLMEILIEAIKLGDENDYKYLDLISIHSGTTKIIDSLRLMSPDHINKINLENIIKNKNNCHDSLSNILAEIPIEIIRNNILRHKLLHLPSLNINIFKTLLQKLTFKERVLALKEVDAEGNTILFKNLMKYYNMNNTDRNKYIISKYHKANILIGCLKAKNNYNEFLMHWLVSGSTMSDKKKKLPFLLDILKLLNKNEDRNQIIELFLLEFPSSIKRQTIYETLRGNQKKSITNTLEQMHPGIIKNIKDEIASRKSLSKINSRNRKKRTFDEI